jgi:hypothetical protein
MSQSLAPCPSCSRHVNTNEPSCPFCKSALPALVAIPGASQRLGRAAAFAFSASLAVAGCTAGVSAPTGDGGTGNGTNDGGGTQDGATRTDGGFPVKDGSTTPPDDGGIQPPYGAPAYGGAGIDGGA